MNNIPALLDKNFPLETKVYRAFQERNKFLSVFLFIIGSESYFLRKEQFELQKQIKNIKSRKLGRRTRIQYQKKQRDIEELLSVEENKIPPLS
jgi:flagellar biogenesis protein FliO